MYLRSPSAYQDAASLLDVQERYESSSKRCVSTKHAQDVKIREGGHASKPTVTVVPLEGAALMVTGKHDPV